MSHTPGPWVIRHPSHGFQSAIYDAKGRERLAEVWITPGRETGEANAKLIAAAPELLEALKEISEGKGPFNRDPLKHADNCIESMKAIAKAAIAKAITVLVLLACVQVHAADFGLSFTGKPESVRTNYNGTVLTGRVAEPTKEFWSAWRTNKAELKADGYTCRPIGKHWQVIKLEAKR